MTEPVSAESSLGEEPIPLQNTWVFWHDRFQGATTLIEYEANLQAVCTFQTVQRFWECFNNLPNPDKLVVKSSLHMMQKGVKPLWEDPKNENGGFWCLRTKKEDSNEVWKELVLAAIGEQFAPVLVENDDINGITVSVRQAYDIIQVWNRIADESAQSKILARIKKLLPKLEFIAHYYKPCKNHADFGRKE